jgi:Putative Ig domain
MAMVRFRIGLVCLASVVSAGLVPIALTGGGVAGAATDPSIETCAGTLSGSTFTLTANCDATAPLTVPDGLTVNGAEHTITARDTTPGSFDGGVVTSAGTSMNIENLTIMGTGFTSSAPCRGTLNGLFFNGAGGSVTNVTVTGITENSACQVGRAIMATGTAGQTLTITGATVSGYQKSGIQASGMTMNVSDSTIGPAASLPGIIGQNGLVYQAGATGTTAGSTVYGSGFGNASATNAAVLLFGATNVTLTGDTTTGAGTDIGVDVTSASTGAIVDRNQIGRTAPDSPDSYGIGVVVDGGSTATVTCNTLSGWMTDFEGVPPQPLCVTTTTEPNGIVGTPYSSTLSAVGGTPPYSWSLASGSLPPGLALSSTGTITGTPTVGGSFAFTVEATDSIGGTATQALTITIDVPGYSLTAGDGGVFTFGAAAFHGSMGGTHLNAPVIGIGGAPAGGYWLGASDGGIFSFGVPFYGSMGGRPLNAPIVGIAATPDGGGYYLVATDGGVFTFGDAHFLGSMGGAPLNKPMVAIAVTPDNQGYYLVAADGGVFNFGDAHFQGSMGGKPLNKPVVGIAVDAASLGYWLVAQDGGVFNFGAPFLGSTGSVHLNAPVVGMAATVTGAGYRLVATDGGIFCFGTAPYLGSMGGTPLNKPVVGMSSTGA